MAAATMSPTSSWLAPLLSAAKAITSTRLGSTSGPPTPDSLQSNKEPQSRLCQCNVCVAKAIKSTWLGSAQAHPHLTACTHRSAAQMKQQSGAQLPCCSNGTRGLSMPLQPCRRPGWAARWPPLSAPPVGNLQAQMSTSCIEVKTLWKAARVSTIYALQRPSRRPGWAARQAHPHLTACKVINSRGIAPVTTMYALQRPSRQPGWAAHQALPHPTACKVISSRGIAPVSTMYALQRPSRQPGLAAP
jgi:hypothetical protein